MNCKLEDSKPDWKAYALGELDPHARREAETHAAACSACQEELAGLRVTLDALATMRDEELPRRIAFVSDKVFEPRWWQRLTQSFLRPSFAAASIIAAAILVHAFVRPPVPASSPVAVDTAVTKAVADTEKRDDQRTAALLATAEKRYADAAEFLNKQVTHMYALNTGAGVR
jgi:anti-sigma factor RsiW